MFSLEKLDLSFQETALIDSIKTLKYLSSQKQIELKIIDGLNHIEIIHKKSQNRLIFRSIFHEDCKESLKSVIKELRSLNNLDSLILDLSPVDNSLLGIPQPISSEPTDNIYDIAYHLKDDLLVQYLRMVLSNVEHDHVSEGLVYQIFKDNKIAIDFDVSILIHFYNSSLKPKNIYLGDLYFEETLKQLIANSSVSDSKNMYEFHKLVNLLEKTRVVCEASEKGCFKCTQNQIKPADNFYLLSRDDVFPKNYKSDIFGNLAAASFYSQTNQTIFALTDPLFIENSIKVFLGVFQQMSLTGQRTFKFDRLNYLKRKVDLKFERASGHDTQEEFIEKNVIFEAIVGLDAEFTDEDNKDTYRKIKEQFLHYKENAGVESFFKNESERRFFNNFKNQTECDLISLINQTAEDATKGEQEAENLEKKGIHSPKLKMSPEKTAELIVGQREELKIRNQSISLKNLESGKKVAKSGSQEKPKLQLKKIVKK